MSFTVRVEKTAIQKVHKSEYQEVGKKQNGDPNYEKVWVDVEEPVTREILCVRLDMVDVQKLMVYLADPQG